MALEDTIKRHVPEPEVEVHERVDYLGKSTVWLLVCEHVEKRIEELKEELVDLRNNAPDSEFDRGAITALRWVLGLGKAIVEET